MGIRQVADAKKDRDHWLEERLKYLTSSDFYSWMGDTPKWWSEDRSSILQSKREGVDRVFPPEVAVSVEHGSFDEEHIISKFATEVGATCECSNALAVNDRWPGLAASIDGKILSIDKEEGEFCFSQDKLSMLDLACDLEDVLAGDEKKPVLLEIKKSTSRGWSDGKVSEWYVPQIQGQMHILELDYAVIVADTVLRKGPRLFWNLTANLVARDDSFADVMDRLNDEFLDSVAKSS